MDLLFRKENTLLLILFIILIISIMLMIGSILVFLKRFYKRKRIRSFDKNLIIKGKK